MGLTKGTRRPGGRARRFWAATLTVCVVLSHAVIGSADAATSGAAANAGGAGGGTAWATGYSGPIREALAYSSVFADVRRDDWAYTDMKKLVGASIIGGDEAGASADAGSPTAAAASGAASPRLLIRPDDLMSREECAVIIARLAEALRLPANTQDTPPYADIAPSRWSYGYINSVKAYMRGFFGQDGERYFKPESPTRRGDLVAALIKLLGAEIRDARYSLLTAYGDSDRIQREWRPYAALAVEESILRGHADGTLRLDEQVTRREACVLIVRALGDTIDFPEPEAAGLYLPAPDSGFYDAFYDDAVFVGDSITQGLRNHVLSQRARGSRPLGEVRFLAAQSYSLRKAANSFSPGGVNLSYQGVNASLEDCLSRMGAKEVYLMLGMNDGATAGSISRYDTIVDKIYAKNPGIDINIQFCTPVTKSRETVSLNNRNLDAFNAAIVELCERRGLDWVDVNTAMKDGQNAFNRDFSSDKQVHMNAAGSESWINSLREFACVKYLRGEWSPASGAAAPETYAGEYVFIE